MVMMQPDPTALLSAGLQIVAPRLTAHGFVWVPGSSGQGSGGKFDSGNFVRNERSLELHFQYSLGLVTYHIGSLAISHADYMIHTGHKSDSRYPGFSKDPLEAFRSLAYDLAHYCEDFLSGSGASLIEARIAADALAKLPGFQRLGEG
jgi:hypothetical protein